MPSAMPIRSYGAHQKVRRRVDEYRARVDADKRALGERERRAERERRRLVAKLANVGAKHQPGGADDWRTGGGKLHGRGVCSFGVRSYGLYSYGLERTSPAAPTTGARAAVRLGAVADACASKTMGVVESSFEVVKPTSEMSSRRFGRQAAGLGISLVEGVAQCSEHEQRCC